MVKKYPEKLKPGDTVAMVCPSSFVSAERIAECEKKLKELGYKVKKAGNLDTNYGGYMAGTGRTRGEWINRMFADKDVKAIFCVRGGDGSSRVMEYLDYEVIGQNPKIFVGYSDVTNIHLGIARNCDFVTFHGPMVSSNMAERFDEETKAAFFQAIKAEGPWEFRSPEGFDLKILKEGRASGRLVGGNLSLLSASIGTPYELDTDGNILFIEEVGEPMTKIEKWIYHLRNSGKIKTCSGILFGQFTGVENVRLREYDEIAVLRDALEGLDIPVIYNVQSGHGKIMMTLPLGAVCTMDTASKTIAFHAEGQRIQ